MSTSLGIERPCSKYYILIATIIKRTKLGGGDPAPPSLFTVHWRLSGLAVAKRYQSFWWYLWPRWCLKCPSGCYHSVIYLMHAKIVCWTVKIFVQNHKVILWSTLIKVDLPSKVRVYADDVFFSGERRGWGDWSAKGERWGQGMDVCMYLWGEKWTKWCCLIFQLKCRQAW